MALLEKHVIEGGRQVPVQLSPAVPTPLPPDSICTRLSEHWRRRAETDWFGGTYWRIDQKWGLLVRDLCYRMLRGPSWFFFSLSIGLHIIWVFSLKLNLLHYSVKDVQLYTVSASAHKSYIQLNFKLHAAFVPRQNWSSWKSSTSNWKYTNSTEISSQINVNWKLTRGWR